MTDQVFLTIDRDRSSIFAGSPFSDHIRALIPLPLYPARHAGLRAQRTASSAIATMIAAEQRQSGSGALVEREAPSSGDRRMRTCDQVRTGILRSPGSSLQRPNLIPVGKQTGVSTARVQPPTRGAASGQVRAALHRRRVATRFPKARIRLSRSGA